MVFCYSSLSKDNKVIQAQGLQKAYDSGYTTAHTQYIFTFKPTWVSNKEKDTRSSGFQGIHILSKRH